MKPPDASIVFVVDDDADVRASIQGLLKSVGLRSQCFRTTQEFLHNEGRTNPLQPVESTACEKTKTFWLPTRRLIVQNPLCPDQLIRIAFISYAAFPERRS
jgi:hypothetical protein